MDVGAITQIPAPITDKIAGLDPYQVCDCHSDGVLMDIRPSGLVR
jgi:hypothetical protein